MAEPQNDPLLPGYSFNAHLVAGLTQLRPRDISIFTSIALLA